MREAGGNSPGPAPRGDRRRLLERLGGQGEAIDEVLAYDDPAPRRARVGAPRFPLGDEPHLEVWSEYERQARVAGVVETLTHRLPQMRFPVARGISETAEYRAATRRGAEPVSAQGPSFVRPGALRLEIVSTAAGRLPALVAPAREDFECLVRVFAGRNEPIPVPPSMGACLVMGFVNWDRVHRHREGWERAHPEASPAEWSGELSRLATEKPSYQDSFVLLGEGPYSAVPAADLGLPESEWLRTSGMIRLAHEATHYASLRLLGGARGHAWDELLADFVGLVSGSGRYRAEWARRFLGIDGEGRYQAGGRLGNTQGSPPLSPPAFDLLVRLVVEVVAGLDRLATAGWQPRFDDPRLGRLLLALAPLGLADMALLDLASGMEEGVGPT